MTTNGGIYILALAWPERKTAIKSGLTSVKAWWRANASGTSRPRRALTSIMLLTSWEIWKERNARVFRNNAIPVGVLVAQIKEEAS